jgi:hypothetical protein
MSQGAIVVPGAGAAGGADAGPEQVAGTQALTPECEAQLQPQTAEIATATIAVSEISFQNPLVLI